MKKKVLAIMLVAMSIMLISACGKNPLIGFMTWEGYNYEDAVLLSERLVTE